MPKVSQKGQVAIPINMRNKFGIIEGTEIEFIEHDGYLTIVPKVVSNPLKNENSFLANIKKRNIQPSTISEKEIEQLKHERRMKRDK
ncbi:MAG: AbrB/MazE/SpoVT family DNA-binding domain-containing protein [Streptococcaceae bacterium]|nr:AbrB/MazE/SpoVT family DNA-binding domain-containing protein [Streptococcaceae bacterium]